MSRIFPLATGSAETAHLSHSSNPDSWAEDGNYIGMVYDKLGDKKQTAAWYKKAQALKDGS